MKTNSDQHTVNPHGVLTVLTFASESPPAEPEAFKTMDRSKRYIQKNF